MFFTLNDLKRLIDGNGISFFAGEGGQGGDEGGGGGDGDSKNSGDESSSPGTPDSQADGDEDREGARPETPSSPQPLPLCRYGTVFYSNLKMFTREYSIRFVVCVHK